MNDDDKSPVAADPWRRLRHLTTARIGLGRAGVSHTTADVLQLSLAHARAQDAVHEALNPVTLCRDLAAAGFDSLTVSSQAADRAMYLSRPDLGRLLSDESAALLQCNHAIEHQPERLTVVVADGLSARAVQEQAVSLLQALRALLDNSWSCGPVVVACQARVALGDEVAVRVHASMVLVMIGERPGLSSPDSMGLYLTYGPFSGIADSRRNCISNVRPAGLSIDAAAARLTWLLQAARAARTTGVSLKDRSDQQMLLNRSDRLP